MGKRLYLWAKDLHLYLGLFISPFLLVFALSVLQLNHLRIAAPETVGTAVIRDLEIPPRIEEANGADLVRQASAIVAQTGVTGEIDFIRALPDQHRLVIPVVKPGSRATIDLDIPARSATVTEQKTPALERLSYLHRMPGPHNAAIRGNWFSTRAWRWLSDATVYSALFLSLSGIYLWAVIRSERTTGLILLLAGALTLGGLLCAIVA